MQTHRQQTRCSATQWLGALALLLLAPWLQTAGAASYPVYGDSLASGWENWSWGTSLNTAATSQVHAGTHALAATYTAAWGGVYLATHTPVTTGSYTSLQFWIHGGSQGGQRLRVLLTDAQQNFLPSVNLTATNGWTLVSIPLTQLGSPSQIGGLVWQDTLGAAQPVFFLDDISLAGTTTPPPNTPSLSVDANRDRHTISDAIYGMNYASESLAKELRLPVRRWGGNATSRYNWKINLYNTGSDWYFENIPAGAAVLNGSASDLFVEQDRRTGTKSLLTLPLLGWTARDDSPRQHPYACGFKVSKYGAQQDQDPWDGDCGNGLASNGTPLTGNAPGDTSSPIGTDFVADWVRHLTAKYGAAQQGGVAYYNLDNEPMLWNSTHRDLHPQPTSYDELRDRTQAYAAAVKAADPGAATLGPVLWGWCAYFYSALDQCAPGADRQNHANQDLVPWYLQQMQAYEQAHGLRILDYLDLHFYPQADGVALAPAGSAATQALRLRSTRALWDPDYLDESWISDTAPGGVAVRLIPRMRDWVTQNYPGTKLAITEYNWGALDHLNGALAQGDLLGIFGREGLDLATLWDPPAAAQPGAFAFRLYRNYDGAGQGFGDLGVNAVSSDPASLAIYAALRSSDQALTLVVINKTSAAIATRVTLSGIAPASLAPVYRYSAANLAAIQRVADQAVSRDGFDASFPAESLTLISIPRSRLSLPLAPSVSTDPPSELGLGVATLNGTLYPNGSGSSAWFEYGLTSAYGHTLAASPAEIEGSAGATRFSANLQGLKCRTNYHYRAMASNGNGASQGADQVLTTSACPPVSGLALSVNPASPQAVGSPIQFSATARGGSGTYEYRYWLKGPSTGQLWAAQGNYSPSATWTWLATPAMAGSNQIAVFVRNQGATAPLEKSASLSYALTP